MPTERLAVDSSHNDSGHYLYDADGVDELMKEEHDTVFDTYKKYYTKLGHTNYTYKYLGGLSLINEENDTMFNRFYVVEEAFRQRWDDLSKKYYRTTNSVFSRLEGRTYKKNSGNSYTFDVIDGYYTKTTIDEKFHALDQVLLTSYYTNTDIDNDDELYPNSYTPTKEYEFKVIDDYYAKTTIDEKFHAIDQALNDLYYKKTDKPRGEKYIFDVMPDYNTTHNKSFELDKCLMRLIEDMKGDINGNEDISAKQIVDINNNKETLTNQKERIEKNTSAIMWTISELEKVIVNNKKEISSNTEIVRPFDELITKIFNILAAQANEEISLNTEVIEDNNELLKDNNELLKDNNESLNKMDKNNEAQAGNNALYVMLTALTAPFIGLSLYYSSDTEENIDNEIEVF